jgi:hypothetical protein
VKLRQSLVAIVVGLVCGVTCFPHAAPAQDVPPELGQGWMPEFTLTSRQLLQLADATPAEKYGWRPGACGR